MRPTKRPPAPMPSPDAVAVAVRDMRDEAAFLGERLPELSVRLALAPAPRAVVPDPVAPAAPAEAAPVLRWRSGAVRRLVAGYIWLWAALPWLRPALGLGRKLGAPVAHVFERLRHGSREAPRPRGRWKSGPALAAITLYERLWNAHPHSRRALHAARRSAAPVFRVVEFLASGRRA